MTSRCCASSLQCTTLCASGIEGTYTRTHDRRPDMLFSLHETAISSISPPIHTDIRCTITIPTHIHLYTSHTYSPLTERIHLPPLLLLDLPSPHFPSAPPFCPHPPPQHVAMAPCFVPPFLPALSAQTHARVSKCRTSPSAPDTPPRLPPRMHGPPGPASRRPGEKKGFVEEMRVVAMKLHTKDQAPREGKQEQSALPITAWYPSKPSFMQFLVDSRHVYHFFETELTPQSTSHPIFSRFVNVGLERLDALDKDIAYLNGLDVDTPPPTQAATRYVLYLRRIVDDKPECVLCHWYNYYFAHFAGGRMIGRLMQERLFDNKQLEFYEWGTDNKLLLAPARAAIDDVAKDWSRQLKDICLKETGLAFGYSGTVLQNLAKPAPSPSPSPSA